jgi:hypothetical protein
MTGLDGSVIAYQLLMDLFKYVWNDEKENHDSHSKRLKPVFELIDRELGQPLNIERLAVVAGVTAPISARYLKRQPIRGRPSISTRGG